MTGHYQASGLAETQPQVNLRLLADETVKAAIEREGGHGATTLFSGIGGLEDMAVCVFCGNIDDLPDGQYAKIKEASGSEGQLERGRDEHGRTNIWAYYRCPHSWKVARQGGREFAVKKKGGYELKLFGSVHADYFDAASAMIDRYGFGGCLDVRLGACTVSKDGTLIIPAVRIMQGEDVVSYSREVEDAISRGDREGLETIRRMVVYSLAHPCGRDVSQLPGLLQKIASAMDAMQTHARAMSIGSVQQLNMNGGKYFGQ